MPGSRQVIELWWQFKTYPVIPHLKHQLFRLKCKTHLNI